MKFSIKTYKFSKIENHFKQNFIFILCNTKPTKSNLQTTQKLKKLNLKYYTPYKTLTKRVFKNSIYKNQIFLVNSSIIIVIPQTTLTLNIFSELNKIVTAIGLKINNKIYSINQFDSFIKFKYNKDMANLLKTMKFSLKPLKLISYDK